MTDVDVDIYELEERGRRSKKECDELWARGINGAPISSPSLLALKSSKASDALSSSPMLLKCIFDSTHPRSSSCPTHWTASGPSIHAPFLPYQ